MCVMVMHLNELYKICRYFGRHDKNVFTSRNLYEFCKGKSKRLEPSESLLDLITDESEEGH